MGNGLCSKVPSYLQQNDLQQNEENLILVDIEH